MYHVNPNTGVADVCKAQSPDSCPFGGGFHSHTKEGVEKVYEEYIKNDDDPATEMFYTAGGRATTDPIGFKTMAAWSVPDSISNKEKLKNEERKDLIKNVAILAAGTVAGAVIAHKTGMSPAEVVSGGTMGLLVTHMVRNAKSFITTPLSLSYSDQQERDRFEEHRAREAASRKAVQA